MANISKDWEEDCLKYHGVILTGNGAHWCAEWDDLPIDETCYEWPCCAYAIESNISPTHDNWASNTAIREETE